MMDLRTPLDTLVKAALVVAAAALAGSRWTSPLAAQETETAHPIEGRVLDASGAPLAGARVQIPELGRSVRTDEWGRYRFAAVPAGTYTLRFGALDRELVERSVDVPGTGVPGAVVVPDVGLAIQAVPLAPLEIVEQRTRITPVPSRVPGSAQVLDAGTLAATVTAYGDIHQLLRRVPGVNVQEEDGYGLRPNIGMRGSGSERSSKITLMEDGVLIAPAPYAAPAAYYFPVAARMEAIEVRKGSSQIKYGPRTIGGALNLVSSPIPIAPLELGAELAGGEDVTRRLKARVGGSAARFGWLAETYRVATNGFKRLPGGEDTGFDIQDYVAKLRWNTDPAEVEGYQQVELKLGYYDERSDETYLGLTDADFRANPFARYAASREDVMNADHKQLQVRHFLRIGRGLDVTTTAYRNEFARNWYKLQSVNGTGIADVLDDPEAFPGELGILKGADSPGPDLRVRANNRKYFGQGIQTAFALRGGLLGLQHEAELGARYHRDQEDRFQHEDGFRMRGGRMILEAPGAPGSQSNRVSDATAWSFYLEDRIEFGRLALTPGVRFESVDFTRKDYGKDDPTRVEPTRVRKNGVDALMPGIGATYRVGTSGRVFGGVHRGFGPPGPGADEATEAEKSVNYELGLALDRPGAKGQLVGFYNDYSNVLGASTLSSGGDGTGDLFNGGSARIWGIEASLALEPIEVSGEWRLPIQLTYTLTHAEFRSSFESDFEAWGSVAKGDAMPYVPEHQLFGSLGIANDTWRLGLEVAYTSAMRTVAGQGRIPEGSGTDAHTVFGMGGEYRLARWGSLFASVQNVTDRRYVVARRPAGARPGLPRTLEAGIRFTP